MWCVSFLGVEQKKKNVLYELMITFEHQLNLIHKRIIIGLYYVVNKLNKI